MERYKVTIFDRTEIPLHKNERGQIVPRSVERTQAEDGRTVPVKVGDITVSVVSGKVQELPDEVAAYLKSHRYYDIEKAGKRAE